MFDMIYTFLNTYLFSGTTLIDSSTIEFITTLFTALVMFLLVAIILYPFYWIIRQFFMR